MESKLKSLKVAELKELLAGVNITTPNRATKADLIAKIIESQAATDAYMTKYEPNSASTAPAASAPEPAAPAETEAEPEAADPAPEPTPTTAVPTTSTSADATTATEPTPAITTTAPPDEDAAAALAARKARAERFGIPFVEDPAAVLADAKNDSRRGGRGGRKARGGGILPQPEKAAKVSREKEEAKAKVPEDGEKLKTRAERFGLKAEEGGKGKRDNKRKSPAVEEVDAEEAERRRKRAERFGTGPAAAPAPAPAAAA